MLGQRRAVDHHGIDASGLRNQGQDRAIRQGQLTLDAFGGGHRSGEGHASAPWAVDQGCPHVCTTAWGADQGLLGDAAAVQQIHQQSSNARCLISRFGRHSVACHQGRHDLSTKDGQREVPWGDAHPNATAACTPFVVFTGGARQGVRGQRLLRLARVVARIVDGLSDFCQGICRGLFRFQNQRSHPARHVVFELLRCAVEDVAA